ncbi:MAG: hypothetical protein NTY97_10870 [Planctomycetota bacterium]|nr:hypothetical protein [Planctomycetota bacterium]
MPRLPTFICGRVDTQVIAAQSSQEVKRLCLRRAKICDSVATRAIGIVALIGFVLCISVGCASGPKIIVPESVVGRWRGVESGSLLEFTETGIFVVESKDGTTLLGRCTFQGTRVTLRYQLGAAVCPEEPGQYTLEVEGSNMRTADPSDSCFDRRTTMAQAWMREAK